MASKQTIFARAAAINAAKMKRAELADDAIEPTPEPEPPTSPSTAGAAAAAPSPNTKLLSRAAQLRIQKEKLRSQQGLPASSSAQPQTEPARAGQNATTATMADIPETEPTQSSPPALPSAPNATNSSRELFRSSSASSPDLRVDQERTKEPPRIATDDGLPMPAKPQVKKEPKWEYQLAGGEWGAFTEDFASKIHKRNHG